MWLRCSSHRVKTTSFGASSVISAVLGFFVDGAITDLSFVVLVAPANFGSFPALFLRWSANAGKFRVRGHFLVREMLPSIEMGGFISLIAKQSDNGARHKFRTHELFTNPNFESPSSRRSLFFGYSTSPSILSCASNKN